MPMQHCLKTTEQEIKVWFLQHKFLRSSPMSYLGYQKMSFQQQLWKCSSALLTRPLQHAHGAPYWQTHCKSRKPFGQRKRCMILSCIDFVGRLFIPVVWFFGFVLLLTWHQHVGLVDGHEMMEKVSELQSCNLHASPYKSLGPLDLLAHEIFGPKMEAGGEWEASSPRGHLTSWSSRSQRTSRRGLDFNGLVLGCWEKDFTWNCLNFPQYKKCPLKGFKMYGLILQNMSEYIK